MRTDMSHSRNNLKKDSLQGMSTDDRKMGVGGRRTLQPLQKTAGVDKENLVGAGRSSVTLNKEKVMALVEPKKPKAAEIKRGTVEEPNASQITAEDLTSDEPSAAYWEALAERRRIALADALEENQRLMERIAILEEENSNVTSRIAHLEDENSRANAVLTEAREAINVLTELLKEHDDSTDFIDLNED